MVNFKKLFFTILIFGAINLSANAAPKERVTKQDLDIRNDVAYLPNENKPFTGRYETFYPNGNKKGVSHIKNGKFKGVMTILDENGKKVSEMFIKDGIEIPVNVTQTEVKKTNTSSGFGSFRVEAESAKNNLACHFENKIS